VLQLLEEAVYEMTFSSSALPSNLKITKVYGANTSGDGDSYNTKIDFPYGKKIYVF
jgi:hypothetical protein